MKDKWAIVKWGIGLTIPLLVGGIAWAAKIESRIATVETIQVQTITILSDIKTDMRSIRDILIEEIRN